MGKRRTLESQLDELAELADSSDVDKVRQGVGRALGSKVNRIVAVAADIARDQELRGFEDSLLDAFERFLEDPIKRDAGCVAKTAIVEAMSATGFDDPDFYVKHMAYRQLEPGWPKADDTAVNVRGACAFGLAQSRLASVNTKLIAMSDLLADECRTARVHAANAIAHIGTESAIPLLRTKALCGDHEVEVLGACFSGLIRLAPADSVPFVARFLNSSDPDVVLEAAAVLGESNQAAAVAVLIEALSRATSKRQRRPFLISIGLSKQKAALDFLISHIRSDSEDGLVAIESLRPLRFYPDLMARVKTAVESANDAELTAAFSRHFPPDRR